MLEYRCGKKRVEHEFETRNGGAILPPSEHTIQMGNIAQKFNPQRLRSYFRE